jgi:hypothetical protein
MARSRTIRCAALVAATVAGIGLPSGPATAAPSSFDLDTTATSWDAAAARLGTAGSLWEPTDTAELDRTRKLAVLADSLAFTGGAVTAGDTYAGTRYGSGGRSFWLDEKWADTGWAAQPPTDTSTAAVGPVRIRLGVPGMRATVTAQVSADCFPQPVGRKPVPVPKRFRCARADVLRTGGTLTMTARPASTMTAPGTTSIVIRTTGLSYRELVDIAGSLVQVAGSAADGAGSAQMVAMCRQMVSDRMTVDQASAFAQSNGYAVRVGSVDGVPMAVTMDYRPDRFTVELVANAVTACTYG